MKKILSIDGGGIRGIIPATILAEIERRTQKPIAQVFDLLAGTSTGGILSLGLGKKNRQGKPEYTAEDLIQLYAERGRDIFARSFWRGVSSIGGFADEKYPHQPLEKILHEYFSTARLGSLLTNTLISSYDIEHRTPFFFKSWRDEMKRVEIRHVARATSAAPTYFEPAQMQVGQQPHTLVDGGVFVNNPAMSAYAEARRLFPTETDFLVVSLGTGELTRKIPYEQAKDWGLVEWALPILSVVFDGVSDAVDYQLTQILDTNFVRFQTRLDTASDDLDNASRANSEALKMEAQHIIETRQADLDRICAVL